ncbi:hypothetical protein D0C16_17725 [Cellvibrio sp. KY-GH-1]|uniref:hypothetical protein n=1 Tax=Cellvibrio sp. KY-GH-1 TaxID=2303332 RepID=UPI001248F430|nr:hypothetical protein [Cellvibrio sp. KY-GH-1]QEY17666.1 hypothetical protein D0C16_17725 [Cellvibrio sp. KY-GH-1]
MTRRKSFELWGDSTPAIVNIISIENDEFNSFLTSWYKFNSLNIENSIYIEISKLFRSIAIDNLLSINNRCVNSDELERNKIFGQLGRLSESYPEFDSIFKKLEQNLKGLTKIPTVALSGLEYVLLDGAGLKYSMGDKYLLCAKDSETVVSIQEALKNCGLDGMCSVFTHKDVDAEGTDDVVIFLGPISWHKHVLVDPPSKRIVFIQPSYYSNKIPPSNIFEFDSYVYGQSPNLVSIGEIIKIAHKGELSTGEITMEECQDIQNFLTAALGDQIVKSSDNYIGSMQPMHAKLEVRFENGKSTTVESDDYIWIINLDGTFEERKANNELNVSAGEYLVEIINSGESGVSVKVFDPDNWQEIMETWKKKLKQNITRISYLESSLKRLGAVSATETNIKNWVKSEFISPQNTRDFIAVLLFAGIDLQEEQEKYIELAKVVKGGRIFAGKTIHSDSRGRAKKIIEKHINESGPNWLDSFTSNILVLKEYEFKLQKISNVMFISSDVSEVENV